jgi:hypothetical protein
MSKDTDPKFTPESFDGDDYELLMAAARLTLRIAVTDPDDSINFHSLYDRIDTLMAAYVNSADGMAISDEPNVMLTEFANAVAIAIAAEPSLRAAVAAHLASTQDTDP